MEKDRLNVMQNKARRIGVRIEQGTSEIRRPQSTPKSSNDCSTRQFEIKRFALLCGGTVHTDTAESR